MFLDRFTFNTSITSNESGGSYPIINEDFYKTFQDDDDLNFVYKKKINLSIDKTFGIIKKYIGFGDIVEFITKYTGVKSIVIFITKGNCGCEKRRIKLNSLLAIPYYLLYYKNTKYYSNTKLTEKNKFVVKEMTEDLKKQVFANQKGCGCGAKKKQETTQ